MPERFAGSAYLHEEAEAEFFEASRRYNVESEEVGAAFEAEVERGVAFVVENPEGSPTASGQVRRKVLRRFPYSLIYAVEAERIHILAGRAPQATPSLLGKSALNWASTPEILRSHASVVLPRLEQSVIRALTPRKKLVRTDKQKKKPDRATRSQVFPCRRFH